MRGGAAPFGFKGAGFVFVFPCSVSHPQKPFTHPHSFRRSPLLIRLGNFTAPCYIRRVCQTTKGAIGTPNAAAAADKTYTGDDEHGAARRGCLVWRVCRAGARSLGACCP